MRPQYDAQDDHRAALDWFDKAEIRYVKADSPAVNTDRVVVTNEVMVKLIWQS
jgi:hypothetical protein